MCKYESVSVKTVRTHYDKDREHGSLESLINQLGYENILQILPVYYGQGEVGYTIIYDDKNNGYMKCNTCNHLINIDEVKYNYGSDK